MSVSCMHTVWIHWYYYVVMQVTCSNSVFDIAGTTSNEVAIVQVSTRNWRLANYAARSTTAGTRKRSSRSLSQSRSLSHNFHTHTIDLPLSLSHTHNPSLSLPQSQYLETSLLHIRWGDRQNHRHVLVPVLTPLRSSVPMHTWISGTCVCACVCVFVCECGEHVWVGCCVRGRGKRLGAQGGDRAGVPLGFFLGCVLLYLIIN